MINMHAFRGWIDNDETIAIARCGEVVEVGDDPVVVDTAYPGCLRCRTLLWYDEIPLNYGDGKRREQIEKWREEQPRAEAG